MRTARAAFSAMLFLGLAGCQARFVPRPMPASFAVRKLDGERLDPGAMKGRPWLVTLWLPG